MKELLSWSPAMYACTKPTACSQKGDKRAEEEAKEAEKAEPEGGREEARRERIRVEDWQSPSI